MNIHEHQTQHTSSCYFFLASSAWSLTDGIGDRCGLRGRNLAMCPEVGNCGIRYWTKNISIAVRPVVCPSLVPVIGERKVSSYEFIVVGPGVLSNPVSCVVGFSEHAFVWRKVRFVVLVCFNVGGTDGVRVPSRLENASISLPDIAVFALGAGPAMKTVGDGDGDCCHCITGYSATSIFYNWLTVDGWHLHSCPLTSREPWSH